jgi:glutathione-regulated potassium-efflux system ancillary protein KefC
LTLRIVPIVGANGVLGEAQSEICARELQMTGVWALAALWLGLALIASLLSIWFRISTALSEIVVGTIAQLIIGAVIGSAVLGTDESWVKFLSGIGAIVLTFLAGAELDPQVFRLKWKEAAAVGIGSFFLPFVGCAAAAHYVLGWDAMPSWLAGLSRRRVRCHDRIRL